MSVMRFEGFVARLYPIRILSILPAKLDESVLSMEDVRCPSIRNLPFL